MSDWQPILPMPPLYRDAMYWVVPKTAEETYVDTSGNPIVSRADPAGRLHIGVYNSWSSLEKAIYWQPLPVAPPSVGSDR